MAKLAPSKLIWNFPARNGGIDYVTDPSSAHFSDAPIPKLVREVVQNSLDAKHDGYSEPIVVEFTETWVNRDLIGGDSLEKHIIACFDRASADGRAGTKAVYKRALDAIAQKNIRCLKTSDSGTVGLDDTRWRALVVQEGAVSKLSNSPGGNYGIGKNAALNVSDLQTVFYTTRYVAGRKGRVEKMQGKSTLMGHEAPDGSGKALQHIGFYAERDGSPLEGRDIPQFFRLDETGTGVFVMGFNPRSTRWVHEMTQAVIENYFCAIADKNLIVKIAESKSDSLVVINHETIDSLFSQQKRPSDAAYYYRAARDGSLENTVSLGELGPLSVSVVFDTGAPRKIALVNRNGMLIADSKDQRINPISPRARGIWPDFAAVVVPATNKGDNWMRSMENPSHDSLSAAQLATEAERRDADAIFKRAREEVADIIEVLADLEAYGEESNIDELTDVLADIGEGADQTLSTTELVPRDPSWVDMQDERDDDDFENMDEDEEEESNEDDDTSEDEEDDDSHEEDEDEKGDNDEVEEKDGDERARRSQVRLARTRVIPVSATEAVIAFELPDDVQGEIHLSLARMGVDRDAKLRDILTVTEAYPLDGIDGDVNVDGGRMSLTPNSNGRLSLRVAVNEDIERAALRVRAN